MSEKQQMTEPRWLMPAVDVALCLLAFVLAYYARYDLQLIRRVLELNSAEFNAYLPFAAVYIVWLYFNLNGSALYRSVRGRSWWEELYIIANGVANATIITMALSFVLQPLVFSRLMMIYVAAISIVLMGAARAVRAVVYARMRAQGIGVQRVLVVGIGDVGRAVLRTMLARKELGYKPVGYLDDNPDRGSVDLGRLRGLGSTDNLLQVLREEQVDLVVITLAWRHHELILQLIEQCRRAGVEVRVVPDVFQLNLRQVQVENLDGIPLLGVSAPAPLRGVSRLLKRAMDIGLILIALPVLVPVFLLVTFAIRLEGPGPIFYRARRVGENGREFDMVKFRSMIPDADRLREQLVKENNLDPRHPKIQDDPRVTRVGRFIRRASLDELPNLFNVVLGHMSLVGPRPPTPDEVLLYESWHRQRLNTIPGLTGLWQVSGRSDVPFDEMCLLDIYYIENWSLRLDIQILLMTLPRVLMRHGAY